MSGKVGTSRFARHCHIVREIDITAPEHTPAIRLPETARWQLIVAAIWMCGFLAWFLTVRIEGTEFRRVEVFLQQFDALLGVSADATDGTTEPTSGIQFLPQRVPLFGWALAILLLAACHGKLVLVVTRLDRRLLWIERFVLCLGIGLSIQSLIVLGCGLSGWLTRTAITVPAIVSLAIALFIKMRREKAEPAVDLALALPSRVDRRLISLCMIVLAPLSIWLLLGACSPPTDFDVLEYHLQGPKDWFLAGSVSYLPHNVYTSFPFLTEMLLLSGMVMAGDWWTGALVGQIVLAMFQILSMLAVIAMATRWMKPGVGWLAAVIVMTTPWTLRISIIPYAEGALTFYLTAATMTVLMLRESGQSSRSLVFLTGLLAGSAMATKYTGLISVVVPVGVMVVIGAAKSSAVRSGSAVPARREPSRDTPSRSVRIAAMVFAAGVVIAVGPWLLKNAVETGNPVYPLGYSVFDGSEWSQDIEARWKKAHSADEHRLDRIPKHAFDVAIGNQWTSGLLFAMAVPALMLWRKSTVRTLFLMCSWQLFAWWAFTHRIDRFWIPVIPLLSLVAASTWTLSSTRGWKILWSVLLVVGVSYGTLFNQLPLVGYHVGLADLEAARKFVTRQDIQALNDSLPPGSKVLMVGEAAVFPCSFDVLYNTTFDDNLFEQLIADPSDTTPPMQRRLLPTSEIKQRLKQAGITHIFVNWNEILRYRRQGSYGYSEFVQPSRFQQLLDAGIVRPPISMFASRWSEFPESDRSVLDSWLGLDRLQSPDGSIIMAEVFAVVP